MDIQTLKAHEDDGLPFRISLEAVNRGVGLVALGLFAVLLAISALGGTCRGIDSISHYYFTRLGGDVMVGALCFIGALLMFFYTIPKPDDGPRPMVDGYLGHYWFDLLAARLAGLCAFGVALVPATGTGCESFSGATIRAFLTEATGGHASQTDPMGTISFDFWASFGVSDSVLTGIHYASAAGMFAVLAYYALVVFPRPQSIAAFKAGSEEKTAKKKMRNGIYRVCGGLILLAIGALLYKLGVVNHDPARLAKWNAGNWTFWFEALGLVAFGISWSLKGRVFEAIRDVAEGNPKQKVQSLRAA